MTPEETIAKIEAVTQADVNAVAERIFAAEPLPFRGGEERVGVPCPLIFRAPPGPCRAQTVKKPLGGVGGAAAPLTFIRCKPALAGRTVGFSNEKPSRFATAVFPQGKTAPCWVVDFACKINSLQIRATSG